MSEKTPYQEMRERQAVVIKKQQEAAEKMMLAVREKAETARLKCQGTLRNRQSTRPSQTINRDRMDDDLDPQPMFETVMSTTNSNSSNGHCSTSDGGSSSSDCGSSSSSCD